MFLLAAIMRDRTSTNGNTCRPYNMNQYKSKKERKKKIKTVKYKLTNGQYCIVLYIYIYIYIHRYIYIYTGCPRRKGQNFGRVFLMLKYTNITQNTYIQS